MLKSEKNKGLLFNQDHFNLLIKLYKSSFIDYNNIEEIYTTITETAVKGLIISRASYWEIENNNLICRDLFDASTQTHVTGATLIAQELPIYFQSLKNGIAIIANDVSTNKHTQELKEKYLIPLRIKRMLDIPVRKDGELIGVFCCEDTNENANWSDSDLAFSRVLCDILHLMIEQGKRRELEKQLLETERKISLITENSNDGFVIIENNILTYISPSYSKMLGYSVDNFLNKTIFKIFSYIHKEDFKPVKEFINKNIAEKNTYFKYQYRVKGKNGKYFWREDAANVLYETNGNYSKYLIISRDISQMKTAEEKTKKLISLSKNLNSKLANFTHIVSHNIRSNTSNMTMLIDVIENTTNNLEKQQSIKLLKESNNKLSEIITHLNESMELQFTLKKRKSEISIQTEINKILNVFKEQITTENIFIELNIANQLAVNTIPVYFESIVSNLISNAIKYKSTERQAFIKISAKKEKRKTIITVEDNGIGIDLVKNKTKIFGMYKTFHDNKDAVGLGLFMAKNKTIVLGGTISVESKVNKGTIFKVIL